MFSFASRDLYLSGILREEAHRNGERSLQLSTHLHRDIHILSFIVIDTDMRSGSDAAPASSSNQSTDRKY